ncbi:MAG: phosphoadenylyl-sulfate reductase [bacterium]
MTTDFESLSAQELLQWAVTTYGERVGLASSFGAEDVVLIDMLCKITPNPTIFTLDTGRLNQETYNLMDEIRTKYKINFTVLFPKHDAVEDMVRKHGMNLFYETVENRKLCCGVRKIEPLKRGLASLDAWITGLRKEQTQNRNQILKVEDDIANGGIKKLNPLADWTEQQVQDYIKKNGVPYNVLHDRGYPSIGCECCTRAVKPGEDPRAGRWWWENADDGKKECGLHVTK